MTALDVTHGVLLYLLLGWKLAQLARAPRNVPLRCVVACLALAAASFTVQLPAASLVSPAGRWLVFSQFSLILATSCALDFFFLFSHLSAADASRVAARRVLAAGAVVALMAVAVALTPPDVGIRDQSVPSVAVLYLLFMAANGGLLADALRWTLRGITAADPALARGLRLASAGLGLMLAALVPLTAVVALRWARLPLSPALFTAGALTALPGIVVFLAGVSYPGAVMRLLAARVHVRHYRLHRQLAPLWNELHRAYPQDALARVPVPAWREAISLGGVHRRYYRRVIECHDGLVRISPRLAADSPQPLAERLVAALRTPQSPQGALDQAVALALPATAGIDADARALAALSHQVTLALRTQAAPSRQQENA